MATPIIAKKQWYHFAVMANTASKIEKLGLAERVNSLMVDDGITVGREIGRILRSEGVKVSDAAVNRYLARVGRIAKSRADKIIQDHVDRVVPDDLKALESIESLALKWFDEEPSELADRLAAVKATIEFEVKRWHELIKASALETDPVKIRLAVGGIVKTCLEYILKDERLQDKRLKAATTAIKVIELKLAKSGMLKDDGRGKIFIVDSSKDYDPDGKPGELKRKGLVVQFKSEGKADA